MSDATRPRDLVVVGAGPAGIHAAVAARRDGLEVLVVDDQPAPGGRVWRHTASAGRQRPPAAATALADFAASGAELWSASRLWHLERVDDRWRLYVSRDGRTVRVEAFSVLLAAGAQERPMPFVGATLPGVMTVGAAQILLAGAGQLPADPVWIAGSGPLTRHYASRLVAAGGQVAGLLDTTPAVALRRLLPHAVGLVHSRSQVREAVSGMARLRRARTTVVRGVVDLEALGDERLEAVRFADRAGRQRTVATSLLLVHEGIIASTHLTRAVDCDHVWRDDQAELVPVVDEWGMTSRDGLFVAGDAAGVAGASAACLRGRITAAGVARHLGILDESAARKRTAKDRRRLGSELAARAFVDAWSPPRSGLSSPSDEAVVCRCEDVTAGEVRSALAAGARDADHVKSVTRAGMGACQGRQCGLPVMHLIAAHRGVRVGDVAPFRVRSPLAPITVGELADAADL